MSEQSRFRVLIREVRRRSVWQVLGVYVAASWAVLQVVDQLVERLSLPEWTYGFALLLLLVGLPIVLATAIVQEGGPGHPQTTGSAAPASAVPTARRGSARWLTWRNAGVGGIVALAMWGLIAAGWLVYGPRVTGAVDRGVSAERLAVMPFAVRGSGEYGYLREGLVDLLSTKLDGAGDLRTVDSHALLSAIGSRSPVNLSPAAARSYGQRFGAGLVVVGNVVEVQDRLRLNATVYDFTGGAPNLEVAAEGEAGQLFELVDSVAAQILAGLARGPGSRVDRTAALTTSSLAALRAYLQGDAAFREGRFEEAYDAFTRATEQDSLFALAHYRRSMAAEWTTRLSEALTAADAAYRHSGRLSERDRRQLEAFVAYRRGAFSEAERLYRMVVGLYPDDVEAWNHLGETLFHYGPFHGGSMQSAREPFERVLSYETFRGAALVHLARLAAARGEPAALDSLVDAFLQTNPEGDRELELLVMQAWLTEDGEQKRQVLERLAGANDQILAFAIWDLANYLQRPDGVLELGALLTGADNPTEVRSWGRFVRAYALVGLGRWQAARAELSAVAAINPGGELEHRALLTLFPPLAAGRPELLGLRDALRRLDPGSIPATRNPTGFFSVHDGRHETLVLHALGLTHARLRESADALAIAARLERMPSSPVTGSAAEDFAWTIRAELYRAQGRSADALAAIERVRMEGWYSQMISSPFLARLHARFLHAELLFEQGRHEEALQRYAHLVQATPHEVMFLGIHHLRQAEILAALGRQDEADRHFQRAAALWADADPEFRAMLDRYSSRPGSGSTAG